MENLFELKHVSCFFGKNDTVTKALEEVNLDILKEECISIIGPSGAGKSTLLNVLAGIIKPTTGVVLYKGKPMPDSISKRANIRLNEFGFIFQSYNLIPTLNVRDNIILPVVMNNEKVDLALYEKLISEINLSGHEKKKPNQLSGGLAQ